VLLNGEWEFALGDGAESAQTSSGQESLEWRPVTLPGRFVEWNEQDATDIRFVWVRREFEVSAAQADRSIPSPDLLGGEHFFIDVPMADFKPWTHKECNLYSADVRLLCGEDVLDQVSVRFGMREIRVVDGDYRLSGQTLWLRGSNLVHEWDWSDVITGKEHAYLVEEAREMNVNVFRTHTQPPPKLWADICDEHGTMILAEFPVLYNYRNHRYTPEEWEEFHRNALADTAAWMARLWNHPAVVMWVLSNESRDDNAWEAGPFRDFVVGLDPTRPTMRTGTTGTKTNYDVHTCGNTNHWTHEGRMHTAVDGWFRQAGDCTVTNSEYMNIFARPKCQWTGNEDEEADRLAYAQLGMEHTEVMRRARLDAILPYMYAGWTRTRRGDPGRPAAHARVSRVHSRSGLLRAAAGRLELRLRAEGGFPRQEGRPLGASRAGRRLLADRADDRVGRPARPQPAVRACGPPARRNG